MNRIFTDNLILIPMKESKLDFEESLQKLASRSLQYDELMAQDDQANVDDEDFFIEEEVLLDHFQRIKGTLEGEQLIRIIHQQSGQDLGVLYLSIEGQGKISAGYLFFDRNQENEYLNEIIESLRSAISSEELKAALEQSDRNQKPAKIEDIFVAPGAVLRGDIHLEEGVSVWYNAVLRADQAEIRIDKDSNVQDGTVIHTDPGHPVHIGRNVSIGHNAIIHGCAIDDNVMIGMGSIIMNGAHIHSNTIIGAGALVSENKEIPEGSLVIGVPGKVVRELSQKEKDSILANAEEYVELAKKASLEEAEYEF